MNTRILALLVLTAVTIPKVSLAHCPLCVVATGGLAVLASSLGLSSAVVGIVTGAFALAMGLWFARLVKRKIVPKQDILVAALVYLTTVLPVMPLAREYKPLFVPFIGAYGSTYTINLFLVGAVLGALVILAAPIVSRAATRLSGRHMPYQQLITIGALLTVVSTAVELIIK